MALADLLVRGVETPTTLYDGYQEKQRQYLQDQQAQMQQQQQMELRNLQMQQARKEMTWGEEDRGIAAEDRQKKLEKEALWEKWRQQGESITNPQKKMEFYVRGRDLAIQSGDSQMAYALNQAIELMKPPEAKQYEPSQAAKDYAMFGGGVDKSDWYENVYKKKSDSTKKRRALSSTEKLGISSMLRGEDWYADLEGDDAKKKNKYMPTGSKGAVEGTIAQLSSDMAQEYDLDPTAISTELVGLLRNQVGIKQPEGLTAMFQRSTFDPVEFEQVARQHVDNIVATVSTGGESPLPEGLTEEDVQANMALGYTRDEVIGAYLQQSGQ